MTPAPGTRSAIGFDLQHSRTQALLREGSGQRARESLVGDGRRKHIPNAVRTGAWATEAVEAFYRERPLPRTLAQPEQLLGWRTDPWGQGFLAGLGARLAGYLGVLPAAVGAGYLGYLVGWPDVPDDGTRRFATAGLPEASPVAPGDALLCRWLAAGGDQRGPARCVVAVAVGERHTTATRYTLDRAPGGAVRRVTREAADSLRAGGGPWVTGLAVDLMRRLSEPPPGDVILPLLDALRELDGSGSVRDCPVWTGPLADRLAYPYEVDWESSVLEKVLQPTLWQVTQLVRDLAVGADLVLAGGGAAAWPVLPHALKQPGRPVWRSPDSATDLVSGAAKWRDYSSLFLSD